MQASHSFMATHTFSWVGVVGGNLHHHQCQDETTVLAHVCTRIQKRCRLGDETTLRESSIPEERTQQGRAD